MKTIDNWGLKQNLDPAVFAREVLIKLNVNTIPIQPRNLADQLGIKTDERPFPQEGYDGIFMRVGNGELIAVNENIKYESRKRFTFAHELGHSQIPWHKDIDYSCDIKKVSGCSNTDPKEKEANAFAAELMMPYKFFEADVSKRSLSFQTLDELAEDKYLTSLQATAIRFVTLVAEPCAVVLSENNKILWGINSRMFKARVLEKKDVSEFSYAFDFFKDGKELKGESNEVSAKAWIETRNPDSILLESSRSFSELKMVLTLLNVREKSIF
jgi:Zn-dependent peptidase ImmA (M78 family)